jgi:short-chain 2-methylacyl-CoA dehydrogenase
VDFDLTEEEVEVRDLCEEVSQRDIAPHAQTWWESGEVPVDLFRMMGGLGLMGLLIPPEYGGSGVSTVGVVAGLEAIGRVDQSTAAAWQAHLTIGSLPLLQFGTEEQKKRWLVPLATGEQLGAFGLTEPEAGSDASAVRTTATRDGNDWLINGTKAFITNAGTSMSGGVTILARVQGRGHADGFANFFIPRDTPGFHLGGRIRSIGWKSVDTRELSFRDCCVPADHVVGTPTDGLKQFLAVLEVGRITIAALSIGLTQAVLDLAITYAKERVQFGQPISRHQAIQIKIADIASELEAVRALVYRTAWLRDQGRPYRVSAAMAKLRASSLAMRAAVEAVQIHGGYGFTLDYPVSRFFLDAKVLEIGEGTNEIQRLVIARGLGC